MVHKIIVNPIYCGHYYYGQTKVVKERRVEVPPEEWKEIILPSELRIVDETTWRVANERLKENRHKSKRPFKVQYLLQGHVYCGSCGRHARASIAGLPIRDHNDQIIGYYRRYGCTSVNRRVETMLGNACPSQNRTISANIVESAVTEWLRQLFENPDDVQAGIERMAHMRVEEQDPLLKKIDATRAAIATQELYISELLESLAVFKNNKRLKAECEQKIFMADATRQELEEKLADYEREFGHTTASIANLSYLYDLAPVILEKMEAGPTYDNLRWIVEALDLKVTLFIDPGDPRNRWIEVKCVFTPASYYRLLYAKKTDGEGHEGPFSMEQLGLKNTPPKMGESV